MGGLEDTSGSVGLRDDPRMRSLFLVAWTADVESRLKDALRQVYRIEEEEAEAERAAAVQGAREACEELLATLSRVTNFSVEEEQPSIERQEFELHSLLRSAVARHVFTADARGIKLSCLVHREVPRRAAGDAPRLRQLLSAFVENAIRVTDAGEMQVRISVDESSADELALRFCISNPVGETRHAREARAAGLGYELFRDVVDLMGGEVGTAGVESWFTVALQPVAEVAPTATAPAETRLSASGAVPPHHPLLLVSSDPDTVPEILLTLQRSGYVVELEEDRKRFPTRLRQKQFSLVLLDADGGSHVTTIATWPSGGGMRPVPIVAVPRTGEKRERVEGEVLLRLVERCIQNAL